MTTVQQYYNGFLTLWTERDQMLLRSVCAEFLPQALQLQEHVGQFLVNLHPEFEPVRAALMYREISPDLDTCGQEVLHEEIRLISHYSLSEEPKALLTAPVPPSVDETTFLTTRG